MSRRAVLLSIALLAASSCDKLTAAVEETVQNKVEEVVSPGPGEPGTPGGEPTEEELTGTKLAGYAECLNRSRERIYDSWQRYTEYVKEDGTPIRKGQKPFLYKIDSELQPCKKIVDEGPGQKPSLPDIEKAATDYHAAASEFAGYTVQLDTYYEQENFKDDDWKLGKDIAPKFKAAFDKFDAAATSLGSLVSSKQDEVDRGMLALIEKRQGKDIEWHSRSYIVNAKAFLHCIEPDDVVAATCEEAFKTLETAEGEFRKVHDGDKAKADKVFWMSSYQGTVSDYFTEAKKLMRAMREGKIEPEDKQPTVSKYNDLVGAYNNLNFQFGS